MCCLLIEPSKVIGFEGSNPLDTWKSTPGQAQLIGSTGNKRVTFTPETMQKEPKCPTKSLLKDVSQMLDGFRGIASPQALVTLADKDECG